jgi:hypothetical protein
MRGPSTSLSLSNSAGSNAASRSIQLPSFLGTHLSSHVSVPSKRKAAALVKERDAFMRRLEQERSDRAVLETWAVIRIQAVIRAHLARLRVDGIRCGLGLQATEDARRRERERERREHRRRGPAVAEGSKFDADRLRAQLAQLTAETDLYMRMVGQSSEKKSQGGGGGGKSGREDGGGGRGTTIAARPDWKKHVGARSESKKARRRRRQREKRAVLAVQRLARGFLGRRACARLARRTREFNQYWASVRIQVHVRRVLSTMRVGEILKVRRTAAAITLQRRARGWFGRVFARMYRIRLDNIQLEDTSALAIQTCWRKSRSALRQQRADQEMAARRIQAITRGKKGRAAAEHKMFLREEQRDAAIRIQATFRAKAAGKEVDAAKARADARKQAMRERQHEQAAAVKVQALHRGKNARAAYRTKVHTRREKAALAIQKRGRVRRAQRKTQAKRRRREEERSATMIQKIHRGKRGRKKFDEDRAGQAVALELEMERIESDRAELLQEKAREQEKIDVALQREAEAKEQDEADKAEAARKIQAIMRGKAGRQVAQQKAAEEERIRAAKAEEARRQAAITRIQAAQRRKQARATVEQARKDRLESLQQDTQMAGVRRRVRQDDDDEDSEEEDEA